MKDAASRTVIVGGGLAGLAAAAALAQRGLAVMLLESRPRLGGRASSFLDKASGTQIDNCQHVSLGCCTNFQHFCRTVGVDDLFRTEPVLYFIGRDNVVNRLSAGLLPAPFHLGLSFARMSYLSVKDLLRIAFGLRALAGARAAARDSISFLEWLRRHRQTANGVERFWSPVLVSALSETLDRIDVASARKVFVDAFLSNRHGWCVQIPTVPLDALYGDRLLTWLAARGAELRLQTGVAKIAVEDGRARGVILRDGEFVAADQVVVAVPHWLVLDLFPEQWRTNCELSRITSLDSAPISSVHLWFDRPILYPRVGARTAGTNGGTASEELPHAMLVDRFSQWIFNRSALQPGGSRALAVNGGTETATHLIESSSYQVVISASRNVVADTQPSAIAKVVDELGDVFPRLHGAALLHARLVTEHRAVFSVRPGAERSRPPQQSPLFNVQLAGDWTRTGWPATMEGAVRSGYLAAENILRHMGRSESVLQPDLPASRLSRVLLGLDA